MTQQEGPLCGEHRMMLQGPDGIWEAKGDLAEAWEEVILPSLAQAEVHFVPHIPRRTRPPFEAVPTVRRNRHMSIHMKRVEGLYKEDPACVLTGNLRPGMEKRNSLLTELLELELGCPAHATHPQGWAPAPDAWRPGCRGVRWVFPCHQGWQGLRHL